MQKVLKRDKRIKDDMQEISENDKIEEEATLWFGRQRDGLREEERAEFESWIKDPKHKEAYEETSEVWASLDILPSRFVKEQKNELRASSSPLSRRSFLYAAAASVAILAIGYGGYSHYVNTPYFSMNFVSKKGEISKNMLPDGSQIVLDTDSAISVEYFAHKRYVKFLYGQAMFFVSHDEDKPFSVLTSSSLINVVGTKFSVRNTGSGVSVEVAEGHVRFCDTRGSQEVVDMYAGDSALASNDGKLISKSKVGTSAVGAFAKGRIRFEESTLKSVLAEFARYGVDKVVASKEVENLKITGSFDAEHSYSFLPTLESIAPVRYEKKDGYTLIVER